MQAEERLKLLSPENLFIIWTVVLLMIIGSVGYFVLPNPVDWTIFYRPAALELVAGRSPYTVGSFFNAPWILIPLIPFAVLPFRMGVAALFATNIALFIYLGWRTSKRALSIVFLLLSLPVMISILFGQIDALVLLGLFLPRPIGLLLLLTKPQLGIFIALFWLIEAWREGGTVRVIRVFWPTVIAFLISFLLFGFWPANPDLSGIINTDHNTSLWPGSLMIGVPLLIYAFRTRQQPFVLLATPFLSPYVAPQSWSIALLGLMQFEAEMIGASIASWGMFVYRLMK
jgi:hypothetical protein